MKLERVAQKDFPTVYLHRIPLNAAGYDFKGNYWGVGETLWRFHSWSEDFSGNVRASSREAAKAAILKLHPDAKFFA